MKVEEVKAFWNTHKKEILVGSLTVAGGVVLGLTIDTRGNVEKNFMKIVKEMSPDKGIQFMKDFVECTSDSNYLHSFTNNGGGTIGNGLEFIKEWCAKHGTDLSTPCTGMMFWIKK